MSIEHLESLFSKFIGQSKILLKSDISNLIDSGENYAGELLKVTISIQDVHTKEVEVFYIVAKKIPILEVFQKRFDIQKTFKMEIQFYETLLPLFQNFQREENAECVMDFFAQFYGSRLNLNGTNEVDKDAVILLENLTISGYESLDRFVGYNLEEAQILLKNLAMLHAVPLAIKIKRPDVFQTKIRPLLNNTKVQEEDDISAVANNVWTCFQEILYESDKCATAIPRLSQIWKKHENNKYIYQPQEPFATFCHGDLWINNTMIKYENGKPIKMKFIDFQMYDYKSPVMDILKFLFTSVSTDVLKDHCDNLLKFYHKHFINNLKLFKCDLAPYNYSEFLKEFKRDAAPLIVHLLGIIPFVVYGAKGGAQIPTNKVVYDFSSFPIRDSLRKNMGLNVKEKLHFIVEYSAKKNWI